MNNNECKTKGTKRKRENHDLYFLPQRDYISKSFSFYDFINEIIENIESQKF